MNNAKLIDQFFDLVAEAQQDSSALARPFHTRVIQLSLLDALSHVAHPNIRQNRQRFVALIDEYAQWELSSTYSLRQLALRLADVSIPAQYPGLHLLAAEVNARMQQWPQASQLILASQIDPSATDLKALLNAQLAELIEPVRYTNLLWRVRNFAVHELRDPGWGSDFQLGQPSPYYHTLIHVDGLTTTWELYFPNELLADLISRSSGNLKARLLRDDIDPWSAFPYNPKWY